jgi:peptidoglycan/xylan/chitin deacetylase (PgdA/CDA1 family)
VVLCYHSVHPTKCFASATPDLFEHHLRWLKQHCDVVPFTQILGSEGNWKNRPRVAVTFDDGYFDNYEYAFPLLQKYGISATFFVTAGLLEKDPAVLQRFQILRQCHGEDVRPMEGSQMREMQEAGMEFGSHTYSHPNLASLDRQTAHIELERSKDILEQRLDRPIKLLAYPFGKPKRHFSTETANLAAETGYEYAAAILSRAVRSSDSKLAVPRFCVTQDDVETLKSKIYGDCDFIGWWQGKGPLWIAKLISAEDFQK